MPAKKSARGDFHLKLSPALTRRLEALAPRLRIRVKRDRSERDAYLTELITALTEHGADRMESGADIMAGTRSFAGAVQRKTRKGPVIARAPLTSAATYAELMARPGVPTPEQVAALEADAALITAGMKVKVRGSVFHTGADLVGFEGTVAKAQRGRTGPLVKMRPNLTVEISPYDLVPSDLLAQHLNAVADIDADLAEGGAS